MENMEKPLFSTYRLGPMELKNRIVLAPMTRCRAIGNVPNALMAEYYAQRAGAGLLITEGTSPSANGLGYARIPGIYTDDQIAGWKLVTEAVHEKGAQLFLQLMHCGRIGHPLNMPEGSKLVAPSAVPSEGQMYTDDAGMQDFPMPLAMTEKEIHEAVAEYVHAAQNAMKAGFDGVELHGANGYLLEQFLHPHTNRREDDYGGSMENRARFVLEVVEQVADAIGAFRVGIRLSPFGVANHMPTCSEPEVETMYRYLVGQLNGIGIAYVHIVDHSSMGAPEVKQSLKDSIRTLFSGAYILSGGYTSERAERDVLEGKGDLVAFGKLFISNPDLPKRLKNDWLLNEDWNQDLFYTASKEGYTDYPLYQSQKITL